MPTVRPATPEDLERIIPLVSQAFNVPRSGHQRIRDDFPINVPTFRVLEDGGRVMACMRAMDFAHFYGGRAVPAAGIASVAVAAEARGKGFGTVIMREALAELRARGVAISSLYPATVPIYRQCGYGFGSTRSEWKARLNDLPTRPDPSTSIEEFTLDTSEPVNAFYERLAAQTNGLLKRDKLWWDKRVFSGYDDAIRYAYVVREAGSITGYVIYQLTSVKDSWRSNLECRDLHWSTAAAARTLLSLASLHRSTGEGIEWLGPPDEPLQLLMNDHTIELDYQFRTMIRLLDVPSAFEARGYAPAATGEVTIGVADPLFAENAGPWRIAVSAGHAKVAPAEQADATADVQTWGSLWTGLLGARDAVRVGALEATPEAVETLEAVLAGPLPWISDFF